MIDFQFKDRYTIDDLLKIMEILRSEDGCPWDKVQTHSSIKADLIEEAYEAYEAVDLDSSDMLREELGDLLLQVVFHSRIEEENGGFDFSDVANDICQKLIVRHPHVFGDVKVNGADDVLKNWDHIKKETKEQKTYGDTLKAVPKVFPALLRAEKLGKRSSRAGVDESKEICLEALSSALKRLNSSDEAKEEAFGEILFYAANLARLNGVKPEDALQAFNNSFIEKFVSSENNNELGGKNLYTLSIDQTV
ncbi:MAG: nucleoside triphosphate pyrophosphohydrolase [Ruminococcus sp.]|nr:nucleoside triphosphate pyrophosphohydrolase [Ruminococcus sp.]